jgi:hypothetical protein
MMPKSSATPLADIVAANRAIFLENRAGRPDPCRYYWKIVPRLRESQEMAFASFAKLNGWSPKPARWFRLSDIAGCTRPDPGDAEYLYDNHHHGLFDHVIYARAHRRPAAIIAQPYVDAAYGVIDAAGEIADRNGLAVHWPPALKASFHNVGGTAFLVFTAKDRVIKWLPEMISGVGRARRIGLARIVGRAEACP